MSIIETVRETTVAPVTRRDVLHRAADLLETNEWPWGQGNQCSINRPICLLMAVTLASGRSYNDYRTPATQEWLGETVRLIGFRHTPAAATWNDVPGRTKAEVVARLREATEVAA